MKKVVSIVIVLACMLMLANVVHAEVITVLSDEPDRQITAKGIGQDGNFSSNPENPGQSPTTGLPWSGIYLPMLVQIDNADGGLGYRAPWGAADADIIYETPLHKNGETRLSFLFSDVIPESAGPVRSARITHVELREEWDAGFVFYGGQRYEGTSIDDWFRQTDASKKGVLFSGTDGENKPWKQYYTVVEGLANPHNMNANVKAIQGLLPTDFKAPSRPFLFTDDLPELGDFATTISIHQKKEEYSSSFTYDPNTNVYLRYVNGEPYVDKNSQEQLSFSNLIIQRTTLTFYHDIADRPMTVNIGSGNADIFIGGRYIPGYWVRTGMNQRTVFFDQEGNELQLQRGKTFISIVDYSMPVSYSVE